jgi:hypothetical protein
VWLVHRCPRPRPPPLSGGRGGWAVDEDRFRLPGPVLVHRRLGPRRLGGGCGSFSAAWTGPGSPPVGAAAVGRWMRIVFGCPDRSWFTAGWGRGGWAVDADRFRLPGPVLVHRRLGPWRLGGGCGSFSACLDRSWLTASRARCRWAVDEDRFRLSGSVLVHRRSGPWRLGGACGSFSAARTGPGSPPVGAAASGRWMRIVLDRQDRSWLTAHRPPLTAQGSRRRTLSCRARLSGRSRPSRRRSARARRRRSARR